MALSLPPRLWRCAMISQRKTITSANLIPCQLTNLPHWVCWRYVERKNKSGDVKITKPPINARTGKPAKSNDPSTYSDFQTALNYALTAPDSVSGIGFVFTEGDGLVGIDIDHCLKHTPEGIVFSPESLEILKYFNDSYCEISPSNEGIRIFCYGELPPSKKIKVKLATAEYPNQGIEWYDWTSPRFLTTTGNILDGASKDIVALCDALVWLHQKYFTKPEQQNAVVKSFKPTANKFQSGPFSNDDILNLCHKARNSGKFEALWNGGGDNDFSRGDLALCGILAFYTHSEMGGGDYQLDSLFRQSGRMRDKWDERHYADGRTYGQGTIKVTTMGLTKTFESRGIVSTGAIDGPPPLQRIIAQLAGEVEEPNNNFVAKPNFPFTDLGNSERLVHLYGDRIRYCNQNNAWYVWSGCQWECEHKMRVTKLAHSTVRSILNEATDVRLTKAEAKLITKHAFNSENATRMKAMVEQARPMVSILQDELDAHPMLLNVANGIVDLKTGQLLPHDPNLLLSQMANVTFDSNAKSPKWDAFVDWCFKGDQELINFVQKAAGYSMAGEIYAQSFYILYGDSDNGKSTFMDTIRFLLGDYGDEAPDSLLIKQKHGSHPTEIAGLKGKRLITSSEFEKNTPLNVKRVKQLTNQTIKGRFMGGDFFTFIQQHTIWVDTNHKPVIKDNNNGIWKRVKLIPFLNKIPKSKMIGGLTAKFLAEESSGILNWLIEGCLHYRREGLDETSVMAEAKRDYQSEQDVIGAFLNDCCVTDNPNDVVITSALFKTYQAWCAENNERALSNNVFGREIKARGFEATRTEKARKYKGISLRMTANDGNVSSNDKQNLPEHRFNTPVFTQNDRKNDSNDSTSNRSKENLPHDENLTDLLSCAVIPTNHADDAVMNNDSSKKLTNGKEIITESDGAFFTKAIDRHCKSNGAFYDRKALEIRKDYRGLYIESPAAANRWLSDLTGEPYPSVAPSLTASPNATKVEAWYAQKFGKGGNGYATRSMLKNSLGFDDEDIEALIAQEIVKACDNPEYLLLA